MRERGGLIGGLEGVDGAGARPRWPWVPGLQSYCEREGGREVEEKKRGKRE